KNTLCPFTNIQIKLSFLLNLSSGSRTKKPHFLLGRRSSSLKGCLVKHQTFCRGSSAAIASVGTYPFHMTPLLYSGAAHLICGRVWIFSLLWRKGFLGHSGQRLDQSILSGLAPVWRTA